MGETGVLSESDRAELIDGLTSCGRATAAALNLNDSYHLSARTVPLPAPSSLDG